MTTPRTTPTLTTLLLAALWLGVALDASVARAQVAVLRVDPAAEGLCAALESALTDVQLVRDPGYFNEANEQNLDPSADATLEGLVPLYGLRLALVPQSADDNKVNVDFRNGQTGQSYGILGIPLENGLLGFLGRHTLRREVFKRLGIAEPPSGPPPGAAQPPGGLPAADDSALAADEGADAETGSADGKGGMNASAAIGFGIGTRTLEWPADGQTQHVETGMFAAYELAARFAFPLSESVELGPELTYQSSLSHEIEEAHVDAPPETIGVRSHHFSGLLALRARLGETFSITPAVGYGSRSLRPDVHHLLTPSYSLAGPILHVAFGLTFGDTVTLTLAPELQYVLVGDELEVEGIDPSGLSVGGDAQLEVALSKAFALALTFREAHALLAAGSESASDVERFVTTRLRWTP